MPNGTCPSKGQTKATATPHSHAVGALRLACSSALCASPWRWLPMFITHDTLQAIRANSHSRLCHEMDHWLKLREDFSRGHFTLLQADLVHPLVRSVTGTRTDRDNRGRSAPAKRAHSWLIYADSTLPCTCGCAELWHHVAPVLRLLRHRLSGSEGTSTTRACHERKPRSIFFEVSLRLPAGVKSRGRVQTLRSVSDRKRKSPEGQRPLKEHGSSWPNSKGSQAHQAPFLSSAPKIIFGTSL